MDEIILVDKHDHQIGTCDKLKAHQEGLLHRAFSIFIFREHDHALKVLLQQRHEKKYHSAGLWSNTCCSHPRPGETILGAANRRIQEEFGFSLPLKVIGNFIYKASFDTGLMEHEYDHVLIGTYQNEIIKPNPHEIAAYHWANVSQLMQMLKEHPQYYTAWLEQALMLALTHTKDGLFNV